ncbi:TPA: hypothetical protein OUI13_002966 [Enterobacter hormaechei]|nr:hypothetical protein [Enterobacter hormaechei]
MDIILPVNKSQARLWAETMINLEARKLVNTANIVGARHLGDGLTRLKFIDEGVRLENGKYPTLSLFFVQITSWVYGDS